MRGKAEQPSEDAMLGGCGGGGLDAWAATYLVTPCCTHDKSNQVADVPQRGYRTESLRFTGCRVRSSVAGKCANLPVSGAFGI